ncbi:MAG: exodeoxyribonuclease III [Bdellovibrionales bacterium]
MRIATWNVNSVRARLGNITSWLEASRPDVLLLQEIKCQTEDFPALEFQSLGYECHVAGQKSYNGVALLSRFPVEDPLTALPGNPADEQARYLEGTVKGVRIASLYLPNGNPVGSEKYAYNLAWMDRLTVHAKALLKSEKPFVFGGDFNVIPADADVYAPEDWRGDALFTQSTRDAFRRLVGLGLTEAYRALHPQQTEAYTFWDYQGGAWQRNLGLRIDHFLLSPEATDLLLSVEIDRAPRAQEKASDHVPVILSLDA